MSEQTSTSKLQSMAARSEENFAAAVSGLSDATPEAFGEFFQKLNIPRTLKESSEDHLDAADPAALLGDYSPTVTTLEAEAAQGAAFEEFHVRHFRKLQWHAARPDPAGVLNVWRLYRALAATILARLRRVVALLEGRTEMSPQDWGTARSLVNKAMADFRAITEIVGDRYLTALEGVMDPSALAEAVAPLAATVRKAVEAVEQLRNTIEAQRLEIAVIPPGYSPVKPAPLFVGDILEPGAWTRFRGKVRAMVDRLESAGGP